MRRAALVDPIKTHCALNSDRLATYEALRRERMKCAALMSEDKSAPTLLEIDTLDELSKGDKQGKGKAKEKIKEKQILKATV